MKVGRALPNLWIRLIINMNLTRVGGELFKNGRPTPSKMWNVGDGRSTFDDRSLQNCLLQKARFLTSWRRAPKFNGSAPPSTLNLWMGGALLKRGASVFIKKCKCWRRTLPFWWCSSQLFISSKIKIFHKLEVLPNLWICSSINFKLLKNGRTLPKRGVRLHQKSKNVGRTLRFWWSCLPKIMIFLKLEELPNLGICSFINFNLLKMDGRSQKEARRPPSKSKMLESDASF